MAHFARPHFDRVHFDKQTLDRVESAIVLGLVGTVSLFFFPEARRFLERSLGAQRTMDWFLRTFFEVAEARRFLGVPEQDCEVAGESLATFTRGNDQTGESVLSSAGIEGDIAKY